MEKIKVKCPHCGSVLVIDDNPDKAGKSLACPICRTTRKREEYKPYVPKKVSDETEIVKAVKNRVGRLFDLATGKEYALKEGNNLVGRMTHSSPSPASIPIDTTDIGMSRRHMYLDVMKGRDGYFHTYISNAENKNATYVNSELLKDDDKIALKDGDIIRFANTKLRFAAGAQVQTEKPSVEEDSDKTII